MNVTYFSPERHRLTAQPIPSQDPRRSVPTPPALRVVPDIQRRRREVALTATWLRELRGLSASAATRTGRFKRSG